MPEPSASTSAGPRAKASTACMNCRARKLKCSGTRPICTNCPLYGATCEYATSRAKSGPPKGSTRKKKDPNAPAEPKKSARIQRRADDQQGQQQEEHSDSVSPSQPPSQPFDFTFSAAPAIDFEPAQSAPDFDIWSALYNPAPFDQNAFSNGSFIAQASATGAAQLPGSNIFSPYAGQYSNAFGDLFADLQPVPSPFTTQQVPSQSAAQTPFDLHPQHFASPNSSNTSTSTNVSTDVSAATSATSFAHNTPSPASSSTSQSGPSKINLATPDARKIFRIQCWMPLFPMAVAEALLQSVSDEQDGSPKEFCSLALAALIETTELTPNTPHFHANADRAQSLSMPSYLYALSISATSDALSWNDPRTLTAAGMAYLSVREVFVHGYTPASASLLRLSASIVEAMPPTSAVRAWFSRVLFLWDLSIALAATPYGPLRLGRALSPTLIQSIIAIHREMPDGVVGRVPGLDLEGDARVFDSTIALAVDLCYGNVGEGKEPIRVQRWLEQLPATFSQGVVQMVSMPVEEGDDRERMRIEGDGRPAERQAAARIIQLIYYSLCTRYWKPAPGSESVNSTGSVRISSIRAAMANIVDTADWFLHTRHYWLWPLAEQGLVFAQNSALGRLNNPHVEPYALSRKRDRDMDEQEEEEGLGLVVAAASTIPPDAPRRGLLLMIQDVLSAALDAFTVAEANGTIGAGHIASTRVLLTVAAAALTGANQSSAPPLMFLQRNVSGERNMHQGWERPTVRMRMTTDLRLQPQSQRAAMQTEP